MEEKQTLEAFYKKLKKQLEDNTDFPSQYLYKFIIPSQEDKKEALYRVFEQTQAEITTKESSSGKYISFSVRLWVKDAQEVIHFYQEAGKVEGIVSL
ncbi:hypothetical protein CAPN006_15620 [Capnocytophaga canimorsus]|uniref:DUF493 family protein n=1 Tax=Capnocytophaga canimorsus TaxID=28188 RepID=UPI001AC6FA04|nr:DUF493 family protein [Capnocytophaga canimorsus]GIM57169.1 hypothetical protein CAPN006_15620 [Capnocytophaga canimorsus]